MSGFGLRRSLHLCYPAYLTVKMNFRFNGAALLQLPDDFWQQALADLPAVIGAFQATAPPSTAQALRLASLRSNRQQPTPRLLHPQIAQMVGKPGQPAAVQLAGRTLKRP